jgi:lysyl-tRNA synthetase class 2
MSATAGLHPTQTWRLPAASSWRLLLGGALAILGAGELVAPVFPVAKLLPLVPLDLGGGAPFGLASVLGAGAGVAALILGRGLLRGRRRALQVAGLMAAVVALVAAAAGALAALAIAATGAVALFATRGAFPRGRGRPVDRLATALPGVAGLAVLAMFALVGLPPLLADKVSGIGAALRFAADRISAGTWWLASAAPLPLALDALLVVAVGSAVFYLHAMLRPAHAAEGHSEVDHARASEILARHCTDSLDPFSLREDKAFHFHGDGFVAYRTLRATAVVSGDPVGSPGSAPAALASFLRFAAERDWEVVVTGASDRYLEEYRALGLRRLHIGNEAIVDPTEFSLEGRAIRKVRQSVGRIVRRGWTIECLEPGGLSPEAIEGIRRVEHEWRQSRPRLQGFAMTLGRLWGAPEDANALYVVARSPKGAIESFMRFSAFDGGLSLDVTRRLSDEPNGLAEAMVVAALGWARERDILAVSLNFAGFAQLMGADAILSRPQRLVRRALRATHGRFQLERLMAFCSKFGPQWQPRYLLYSGRVHLPRAGLRVLQAEAYLRAPRSRVAARRWLPAADPVPPVPPRLAGAP